MTEQLATNDNDTKERMLPLYEGKMIHHFDLCWATYGDDGETREITDKEKTDRSLQPMPRYWVRESVVMDRLLRDDDDTVPEWLLGFRDITNSTNERTIISSLFPVGAVGNNLPLVLEGENSRLLSALLSSFVIDFIARFKVGGTHLNLFIAEQLPILPPSVFDTPTPWDNAQTYADWTTERVDYLMEGPWDAEQRAHIRAELDALMFHMYGMDADDIEYIMGTFPIVQRKDEEKYGEYRTKRMILERFEALWR